MKSVRNRWTERSEPFTQHSGVSRLAIWPNDEAARLLVAQIPGDRGAARKPCRQIEIEPAARKPDRIAAGQAVRARHVPAPILARGHCEHHGHAARTRDF